MLAAASPGLITAIVPRHPARGAAIAEIAALHGVAVRRRAAGEGLPESGGVYVADTLGELGLLYRLADVAFIGGSFVPVGGHNPVEPAALGAAIIHGPYTHNFALIYEALLAAGGSVLVADAEALAGSARRLLGDPKARHAQTEAADRALSEFTGAEARTLEALRPLLDAKRNAGR
jgi:3-deoxy-D-manno-octulosonic-acid transferase